MHKNGFCDRFGIKFPVWNAGMGPVAGVNLAVAVSEAGGLGVLGLGGFSARAIYHQIIELKERTGKPFGVNLIMPLMSPGDIECCLAEHVPVLVLFWGDPAPYVRTAHKSGTSIVVQVGTLQQAEQAAAAGVDAVIVQGVEAGGHSEGTLPLSEILPVVVGAIAPIPVIAAGGIVDHDDVCAAMRLGAQAVSVGTRFLCTAEADATDEYKRRVIAATADDTVITTVFDLGWPNAPHRVLHNRIVRTWEAAGRPASGLRPGEGDTVGSVTVAGRPRDIKRYSILMPIRGFKGDYEDQPLYCGQGCTNIHAVRPAAEIVGMLAMGT